MLNPSSMPRLTLHVRRSLAKTLLMLTAACVSGLYGPRTAIAQVLQTPPLERNAKLKEGDDIQVFSYYTTQEVLGMAQAYAALNGVRTVAISGTGNSDEELDLGVFQETSLSVTLAQEQRRLAGEFRGYVLAQAEHWHPDWRSSCSGPAGASIEQADVLLKQIVGVVLRKDVVADVKSNMLRPDVFLGYGVLARCLGQ